MFYRTRDSRHHSGGAGRHGGRGRHAGLYFLQVGPVSNIRLELEIRIREMKVSKCLGHEM